MNKWLWENGGKWKLHSCPRCKEGDMLLEFDTLGEVYVCLQCGYSQPKKEPLRFVHKIGGIMTRHKHRFVAVPITGQNVMGHEAMFGWRVECEVCYKEPKLGDIVEEVKASWWHEIVPESKLVSLEYK